MIPRTSKSCMYGRLHKHWIQTLRLTFTLIRRMTRTRQMCKLRRNHFAAPFRMHGGKDSRRRSLMICSRDSWRNVTPALRLAQRTETNWFVVAALWVGLQLRRNPYSDSLDTPRLASFWLSSSGKRARRKYLVWIHGKCPSLFFPIVRLLR